MTSCNACGRDERKPEAFDSRPDTFLHSQRVGELLVQIVGELLARSHRHDRSKTEAPEREMFDEFTPKLKHSTYGSDEYKGFLVEMGTALEHHYTSNRHHPEHFGAAGVAGMNLIDVVEMLADWKAATERHADGDLARSLVQQRERFRISDQLAAILTNTARDLGWIA